MTGAKITVQGDKEIEQALDRLSSHSKREALMAAIGQYGVTSTKERFNKSVSPDGEAWKPSLRVKEGKGKTLVKSALLKNSMTFHADHHRVEWGTPRIYAGIHQFGGDIRAKDGGALKFTLANGQMVQVKKVTMPARPFLGINAHDRTRISEITGNWMTKMAGGAA